MPSLDQTTPAMLRPVQPSGHGLATKATMHATPPPRSPSALLVLLSILAVAAIGFGLYEYLAARRANALVVVLTNSHESELTQIQQLGQKLKGAEQRAAAQLAGPLPDRPDAERRRPAAGGSNAAEAKAKALEDGKAFLATYGQQAHDMLISVGKAQVARNFAALIESGTITAAQADEIETQTAEQWVDTLAVTPNSVHPTDPTLSDEKLKSILGDQTFQQVQNYQRMQPLQALVNDVSSLSFAAPLTPGQSTQLMTVMANASGNYVNGGKANAQTVDWNQVLPQAQGILSDAQLSALKAEAQLPQLMALVKQYYLNSAATK